MKKIIILVLITLMLTGCKTKTYKTNEVYWNKFTVIEERHNIGYGHLRIVYDKDTKVMYYLIEGTHSQAISPIYNADGTIMIYEGSEDETDN